MIALYLDLYMNPSVRLGFNGNKLGIDSAKAAMERAGELVKLIKNNLSNIVILKQRIE